MAKTNIVFNGTDYFIDDASLSAAVAELKSHLSTAMNGTGAVINIGGIAYNVDATKLAAATNNFVAHLGQIAGNGTKVVVGGVEYSVDPSKIQGAISEIETALGSLNSGDSDLGFYIEDNEAGGQTIYVIDVNATLSFEDNEAGGNTAIIN